MPVTPHIEKHFTASDTVRDVVIGGLVPLSPYFFMPSVHQALIGSVFVTLAALGIFGYVKGKFTVKKPLKSAWQTMAVGSLAAAAAFTLAKLLG